MELITIEQGARWITAGLFLIVLIQQIRWLNALYAPIFASYLALLLIQTIWSPHTLALSMLIEPWVLAALTCSLIEAVSICLSLRLSSERKWILISMLSAGALGVVSLHGYMMDSSPIAIYRGVRQHLLVALATAGVIGAVCYATEGVKVERGPRAHYLILTGYLVFRAVFGFLIPKPGEPMDMTMYRELHIWYFVGTSICLALWLRLGRFFRLQ